MRAARPSRISRMVAAASKSARRRSQPRHPADLPERPFLSSETLGRVAMSQIFQWHQRRARLSRSPDDDAFAGRGFVEQLAKVLPDMECSDRLHMAM